MGNNMTAGLDNRVDHIESEVHKTQIDVQLIDTKVTNIERHVASIEKSISGLVSDFTKHRQVNWPLVVSIITGFFSVSLGGFVFTTSYVEKPLRAQISYQQEMQKLIASHNEFRINELYEKIKQME